MIHPTLTNIDLNSMYLYNHGDNTGEFTIPVYIDDVFAMDNHVHIEFHSLEDDSINFGVSETLDEFFEVPIMMTSFLDDTMENHDGYEHSLEGDCMNEDFEIYYHTDSARLFIQWNDNAKISVIAHTEQAFRRALLTVFPADFVESKFNHVSRRHLKTTKDA